MENNEANVAEAMETVENSGNGVGVTVVLGAAAIAGALLWNCVAKPVGRVIKKKVREIKQARASDKDKAVKTDSDE